MKIVEVQSCGGCGTLRIHVKFVFGLNLINRDYNPSLSSSQSLWIPQVLGRLLTSKIAQREFQPTRYHVFGVVPSLPSCYNENLQLSSGLFINQHDASLISKLLEFTIAVQKERPPRRELDEETSRRFHWLGWYY